MLCLDFSKEKAVVWMDEFPERAREHACMHAAVQGLQCRAYRSTSSCTVCLYAHCRDCSAPATLFRRVGEASRGGAGSLAVAVGQYVRTLCVVFSQVVAWQLA